jgi:hypothetical protein
MALGVVALFTWGAGAVWRIVAPRVASSNRYLLPVDGITISPLPEWIVADVRGQVIQDAGLADRLSILAPDFLQTIEQAFLLHPWVESVKRIEKRPPRSVYVELAYRRPVAVVDVPQGQGTQELPVDAHGIHLPADDVPAIRRRHLPRITGIAGQPPAGQPWEDPRLAGAVELAVRLGDEWESLHLDEIIPSAWPVIQNEQRRYEYDMATRGGTLIVWGAAPAAGPAGDAEFAIKLGRLKQCVAQYATKDLVDWPEAVDVSNGITIKPREAKVPPKDGEFPVVK